LESRIHVPFTFEPAGSQIVFYEPETDYHEAERARQHQPIAAFKDLSSPGLTEPAGANPR
jgi:D-glycero-alpha-D-manno-heptose-7-phosphate kinase